MARIIRRDGEQGAPGPGAPEVRTRYITRHRTTDFDSYVQHLVEEEGFGVERHYFGCETEERAREVRRGLRRGATHLGVSLRAYWGPCPGCKNGGPECRYHVYITAFAPEDAKRHMASRRGASAGTPRTGRPRTKGGP